MPKQLLGDTSTPLEAEPGQIRREDYTYERLGAVDTFMFFEPPLQANAMWRSLSSVAAWSGPRGCVSYRINSILKPKK